ncbi:Malate dehydrogenase, glyoxysomal [Fusarium oxysporum f. sp. cubense race 1]|uniref:malate dehydrogenase n=1 Tax=Fusarium oxysporum f. sp. cubense (strain race 1) TaxID=1229664 RepID=N4U7A9_FUSC1|nr:Malate dehydrogenase, glyoxysomal [Fusarium oxysporum f. sp. cubense race 1]
MTKIALLGAAGQIGTPLSLLCKASNLFTEIALYDLVHTPGIATDLNHIDTKATVSGFLPADDGLAKALSGADIVVVTAGIARKPGMTRDVAAETLRTAGVFEPARLFGVTTLDVVRASTFAAHALGGDADPTSIKVPVIGGHSGATILPLYSQAQPPIDLGAELPNVINRVQFGGDEIVKSKQGAGSATTCMAYAGFRFVKALLTASSGTPVIEEAYVYLPGISGGKEISTQLQVDYFSVKVKLGEQGAREVLPIGNLSDDEKILLEKAVEELRVNIQTGLSFVAGK